MELREVVNIVRRHRVIAVVGVLLAIVLSAATYVVSQNGKYSSSATIFLTEQGFPYSSPATGAGYPQQLGNFANLASIYAQIVQSDAIRLSIGAPLNSITANVVTAASTGTTLPFLDITATGSSPSQALHRVKAASAALRRYISAQERAAHAPAAARVTLHEVNAPLPGVPLQTRTRVVLLPGVVALTVLLATLGSTRFDASAADGLAPKRDTAEAPVSAASLGDAAARRGAAWRRT
jgi:capsular polysaccharide biosynthesis protein